MWAWDKTLQNVSRSLAPTTFYGLLAKSVRLFELQSLPHLANEEVDSPFTEITKEMKWDCTASI